MLNKQRAPIVKRSGYDSSEAATSRFAFTRCVSSGLGCYALTICAQSGAYVKGKTMKSVIVAFILCCSCLWACAELKLSPVHPGEDVEYTLNQRFGVDNALRCLEFVRASLTSFRKLTEESKGKIPDSKLKEIGNTDWETQNLGFQNNPNSIEGTVRRQDYMLKKLEFELAKARQQLGQCPDSELRSRRDAYEKAEKEFQEFWNGFGVVD